ncbi:MotA/TolQ/ExbB proton channel family protein, partial [Hyphomicrobiales bacterium]|nr:MotA/TolQ/ExbB proton channel family protein [Hyphomicrobiales bacterium]
FLQEFLLKAFLANLVINSIILSVLIFGCLFILNQVIKLFKEVRWVNNFQNGDLNADIGSPPSLLAPMATMMLDHQHTISLSTTSMRSLLDSIASRLDEAREYSRYMIGLLIFLGLLGTFWGLLMTIDSISQTIGSLNLNGEQPSAMFEELKQGLEAPLSGMAIAFSSSLFGLSGSLILGFLDLIYNQAQNRFYNELEEWLSTVTEINSDEKTDNKFLMYLNKNMKEMHQMISNLTDVIDQSNNIYNNRNKEIQNEQELIKDLIKLQSEHQLELIKELRNMSSNKANSK